MNEDTKNATTYHAPNESAVTRHEGVRTAISTAMDAIKDVVPDSREKSIAITKLEEAMFWANAGIARNHDKL